jgi:leader peptidase (prepilin peptidase) / N-methyltransferase
MNETAFMWLAAFWMAAIGGSVGSFLNVVVYRLPAGMNLSYPSSHCPKCGHPIRWHDNVPVFGWLLLRGRCRDCRTWIPLRYPTVEASVAALFLLIAIAEGATMGANLPIRPVPVVDGVIFPPLTVWQLAGITGWHLLLLCTLLSASLIRCDGHDVPSRLFMPAFAVGLVGSAIWPCLHPQPAAILATGPTPGVVDALAGLAAGAVLGLVGWKLLEPSRRPDLALAAALMGTILGWQAALVVGGATVVFGLLSKAAAGLWAPLGRVATVCWLGVGATAWIVQWHWLAEVLFGTLAER